MCRIILLGIGFHIHDIAYELISVIHDSLVNISQGKILILLPINLISLDLMIDKMPDIMLHPLMALISISELMRLMILQIMFRTMILLLWG